MEFYISRNSTGKGFRIKVEDDKCMSTKKYPRALSGKQDAYHDYWLHSGEEDFSRISTLPTVCLIYAGELIVECADEKLLAEKGDCLFLKGGVTANVKQRNCGHDTFCGIFFEFNPSFLLDFHDHLRESRHPSGKRGIAGNMMKLQNIPCIRSLYISMIPFLEAGEHPSEQLLKLKQSEAVYSLLTLDDNFYPCLFNVCDTSLMKLLHKHRFCKN